MIQKMKKSKGFTLIEMLVVIAIIAVLVSIIIPVVGNSTTKAKAATNAANLRSLKAEITVKMLEQGTDATKFATFINDNYSNDDVKDKVKFHDGVVTDETNAGFVAEYKDNEVYVTYNGKDIQAFADVAGKGE